MTKSLSDTQIFIIGFGVFSILLFAFLTTASEFRKMDKNPDEYK